MANLTRTTYTGSSPNKQGFPGPSLATISPGPEHQIAGLVAGEALTIGDMVYIKSDGKLWKADGTGANAAALAVGMVFQTTAVGEAVTAYHGVLVYYGSSLTPGARYYVSATAGFLDATTTTGGTVPVALAYDANTIFVLDPTR
jgi:hypothetical protein